MSDRELLHLNRWNRYEIQPILLTCLESHKEEEIDLGKKLSDFLDQIGNINFKMDPQLGLKDCCFEALRKEFPIYTMDQETKNQLRIKYLYPHYSLPDSRYLPLWPVMTPSKNLSLGFAVGEEDFLNIPDFCYRFELELFSYDINELILMNRMKPNTMQHRDLPLRIYFYSSDFSYSWSKFLELTKGIQTILHLDFYFDEDIPFLLSWDFIRDLSVIFVRLLRDNFEVSFGSFLPFLKKKIIRDLDSKYKQIQIYIPQWNRNGDELYQESLEYSNVYGRYLVQGKIIVLLAFK